MEHHLSFRVLLGSFAVITFITSSPLLADAPAGQVDVAIPKCDRPAATLAVESISCSLPRCRHSPGENPSGVQGPGSFLAGKMMRARGEEAMVDLKGSEKKLTSLLIAALKETGCFTVQEAQSGWESSDSTKPVETAHAKPADYRLSGGITKLETKMKGKSNKTSEKINQEARMVLNIQLHRGDALEAMEKKTFDSEAERIKRNANMFSGYDWSRQAETGFGDTALADVAKEVTLHATRFVTEKIAGPNISQRSREQSAKTE